ncbi:MAG: class I SAM-dependent methyltransferase [Acidobacteriota bacterium]
MENRETEAPARPDYGIDAPGVVRNLFIAGGVCLAIAVTVWLRLWSGVLVTPSVAGVQIRFPLGAATSWAALALLAMATWMIWESLVGKIRGREKLLDQISWNGNEEVLDVGCGRGLMLIGAAKRLTSGGLATGVDIWQSEDLSGNRPEAALENAQREGVEDRVRVKTADMRKLPFPNDSFHVVLSSVAIHNIYSVEGRGEAISEIARVLRPGGQALIDDIRHGREYAAAFARSGCEASSTGSRLGSLVLTLVTFGSLRPVTLLARKKAAPRPRSR